MSITLKTYDFIDLKLFEEKESNVKIVWIPTETCIVLGQSNSIDNALIIEKIIEDSDSVPVYKRPSGGQTVVLTPNTIIISIITITKSFNNPQYYFQQINEKIMEVLKSMGLQNILYKGISDIAIGEKKILGSSIYRRKEKLLYHAVLNVAEPTTTFEKYLKHPVKEPDYRNGRSHGEFVTSLKEQGCDIEINMIAEKLREGLNDLMM